MENQLYSYIYNIYICMIIGDKRHYIYSVILSFPSFSWPRCEGRHRFFADQKTQPILGNKEPEVHVNEENTPMHAR